MKAVLNAIKAYKLIRKYPQITNITTEIFKTLEKVAQ